MSCHLQRNLADIPELPNDLELLELWTRVPILNPRN